MFSLRIRSFAVRSAFRTGLLGFICCVSACSRTDSSAAYPVEHGQPTYFEEKNGLYRMLGTDPGDIVLVGDDIIDRGIWNRFYGDLRIRNRGIALEGTQCTASRLPEIAACRPGKIFLCTGLYDLKIGKRADRTAEAVTAMVRSAARIAPDTEWYVMGLTADPALVRTVPGGADSVRKVNRLLQDAVSGMLRDSGNSHFTWLDPSSVLADSSGVLRPEYTFDGARINGAGYAALCRYLAPHIGKTAVNRADTVSNDRYRARYPGRFGHYYSRVSLFNTLPLPEGATVMLGNSLTNNAWWEELLDTDCWNLGISGDTSEGLLMRLDSICNARPGRIFLMISVNDFINDSTVTAARVWENYRDILKQIRTSLPETRLYVQSTLPLNPVSPYWPKRNEQIRLLNGLLAGYASEYGYEYLDVAALVSDSEGNLDRSLTADGIHLLPEAYRRWAGLLRSRL